MAFTDDMFLRLLRSGPVNHHQIPINGGDLYRMIQRLFGRGFKIYRIDAGGNPTWQLGEDMLTESEARARGADLMKKLRGTGWKLHVHENCGWHFACYNGTLSVFETHGEYRTLFGINQEHPSCGEIYWSDNGTFTDPNEAVENQMKVAKAYFNKMRRAIDGVEKRLKG